MSEAFGRGRATNFHRFSLGTFTFLIHKGNTDIELLSGQFNITQTGGDSTINIGPCLTTLTICGGKLNLHIDKGVSSISTTGGFSQITTGLGHTRLNAEDGVCYVKIPASNGKVILELGSGITFVNCKQMKQYKKIGNRISVGTGNRAKYEAQIQTKPNKCIIDGQLYENGKMVEKFSGKTRRSKARKKFRSEKYKKIVTVKESTESIPNVSKDVKLKRKTDLKQKCRESLQEIRKKKRAKILDEKRKIE